MIDPLIAQLVEARTKAGLTQRALAKAAGTVQSHISDLETGQGTHGPVLVTLRRWAQALGLELVLVPLAYRPGFEDPQTAPAGFQSPAGNGAAPGGTNDSPHAPASDQPRVGSDPGWPDVAPALDFPTAWAIQNEGAVQHDPRCSSALPAPDPVERGPAHDPPPGRS